LIAKLIAHADHVSGYLWDRFSAAERRILTVMISTPAQKQTALASALNRILQGTSIYDAMLPPGRMHQRVFADVTLSPQTAELISETPTGADLIRLNRLLLEDAYAPLLAKRLLPPDMSLFTGELSEPVKSLLVRLYKSVLLCGALKMDRAGLS